MKIRDILLPDFIEEVVRLYGEAVYPVLDEFVSDTLWHSNHLRPGDSFQFYSLPLYVLARILKPKLVLETGTQNGGSAQAILCALQANEHGYLFSIDSGPSSTDGTHADTKGAPGERITETLKDRWVLHMGLSQDFLLPLLDRFGPPDLFFHDSDHSKACVEFEFQAVLKYAQPGALLCLHDHYGQWNHREIMAGCDPIIGHTHPEVHEKDGVYHNVLRAWREK